jgi:hypothetical protein
MNKSDIFFESFIELFVVHFRSATTVFLYVPAYTHETFCVIAYVSGIPDRTTKYCL